MLLVNSWYKLCALLVANRISSILRHRWDLIRAAVLLLYRDSVVLLSWVSWVWLKGPTVKYLFAKSLLLLLTSDHRFGQQWSNVFRNYNNMDYWCTMLPAHRSIIYIFLQFQSTLHLPPSAFYTFLVHVLNFAKFCTNNPYYYREMFSVLI